MSAHQQKKQQTVVANRGQEEALRVMNAKMQELQLQQQYLLPINDGQEEEHIIFKQQHLFNSSFSDELSLTNIMNNSISSTTTNSYNSGNNSSHEFRFVSPHELEPVNMHDSCGTFSLGSTSGTEPHFQSSASSFIHETNLFNSYIWSKRLQPEYSDLGEYNSERIFSSKLLPPAPTFRLGSHKTNLPPKQTEESCKSPKNDPTSTSTNFYQLFQLNTANESPSNKISSSYKDECTQTSVISFPSKENKSEVKSMTVEESSLTTTETDVANKLIPTNQITLLPPLIQMEPEELEPTPDTVVVEKKIVSKIKRNKKRQEGKNTRSKPKNNKENTKKNVNIHEVKNYITGYYTDVDVLLGRGGRTNHHPGNEAYLQEKMKIQPRYMIASKEEKTLISQELVDMVHNKGGRFLKLDKTIDQWYVVDNTTARKKAAQTLREINTPEFRAKKRAKYYGTTTTKKKKKTKMSL